MLYGCATVEVAKEVTKATNSIKTTIKKITLGEEELEEKVSSEENSLKESSSEKNRKEKIYLWKKKKFP